MVSSVDQATLADAEEGGEVGRPGGNGPAWTDLLPEEKAPAMDSPDLCAARAKAHRERAKEEDAHKRAAQKHERDFANHWQKGDNANKRVS